jgi:hypothetical protein
VTRQPFLRFFAFLLAILAGLMLAFWAGVPQAVWRADQSMMTSAIGALFVFAAMRIGISSWRGGDLRTVEFGHWASVWSVKLGLVGTALGLSMQAAALAANGVASLGALSTSLFTTATGVAASIVIEVLAVNLEASRDA